MQKKYMNFFAENKSITSKNFFMKKKVHFCLFALSLLTAIQVFSQAGLSVSPGSQVFIASGTPVSIGSLVLTPSVDFTISGANDITRHTTTTNTTSDPYAERVYRFSSAIFSFSGTIGFYYKDNELNGLPEDGLFIWA